MKAKISVLVALAILPSVPLALGQDVNRSKNLQLGFRFQTRPANLSALNRPSLFGSPLVDFGSKSPGRVPLFLSHVFLPHRFFFWNPGRRFDPLFLPHSSPFFAPYGYYGGPADSQSNGVQSFIDQWGNQNPLTSNRGTSLSGSLILSPGMTEEDVTRLLGSPIEKISSGELQIWKYSGFSLQFENDKLKALR
jgi:hypothetical protein